MKVAKERNMLIKISDESRIRGAAFGEDSRYAKADTLRQTREEATFGVG